MNISDAINTIESVAGVTDESTPAGEAWAAILRHIRSTPVAQPVPVSERLPGPGDCDEEGMCWWGTPSFVNSCTVTQSAQWRLSAPDDRFGSELFWLPAHALPLPREVK